MLDPNELTAAIKSANQFGAEARTATTAGFMAGVPGTDVASASNVANVIDAVHATGLQMLGSLSQIKGSIDSQVFAHQEKQRAQRSYDYAPDMSDLRPTDAQGFPKEHAAEFLATFKNLPKA